MLTAFFGDTHGHLDYMFSLAQRIEAEGGRPLELLVQIGDFGAWQNADRMDNSSRKWCERHGVPLEVGQGDFPAYYRQEKRAPYPVLFIRGNHEDQDWLLQLDRDSRAQPGQTVEIAPNFFFLPDGRVTEWGGIRFAGWGGNFSWKTWRSEVSLDKVSDRRRSHMTKDRFDALLGKQFDVLLTHDAPTGVPLRGNPGAARYLSEDEMTGGGCVPIRELIESCQPRYAFSGHWHESHQTQFGRTSHFVLDKTEPQSPDRRCYEVIDL